jgi:hypothetical protein
VYHTFFPLDGPIRGELQTPTPGTPLPQATANTTATAPPPVPTGQPYVTFISQQYTTNENANATITVILNTAVANQVTVNYTTEQKTGGATEAADFTKAAGTLTFAPGETTKTFAVPILEDNRDEPDEAIKLTLSNATGVAMGTAAADLVILDNDDQPSVRFESVEATYDETTGNKFVILKLSHLTYLEVEISLSFSGTATEGADYSLPDGSKIKVSPYTGTIEFKIKLLEDSSSESKEKIVIRIAGVTNGTIEDPDEFTLWIKDDD